MKTATDIVRSLLRTGAFAAIAFLLAPVAQAYEATIPAPNGVGDVVALTNALTELNLVLSAEGGKIYLEPGVYNLSGVYMTDKSHLNIVHTGASKSLLFAGKGAKPGDTVLIGGGKTEKHRVIQAGGGGNYGWATFSNLTVTCGYVEGEGGGGIKANHSSRYIDMIITNNYAGGSGGGCYGGQAYRCLFADNRAGTGGSQTAGAFYAADNSGKCGQKSLQVSGAWDCVFTNNTLNGSASGGAIYLRGVCKGCKFYDNAVTGSGGGGIRVIASTVEPSGGTVDVSISDCLFVGNTGRYGGAIYGTGCIVTNCTFICNKEDCEWSSDGGGALRASSVATILDCRFEGNGGTKSPGGAIVLAGGGLVAKCSFTTNSSPSSGGAIYVKEGDSTILNSTFTGNTTASNGGGVCGASGASCIVSNSVFTRNSASSNGGVAYSASLVGCTITNNQSATVLYDCDLDRCLVSDNTATGSGDAGVVDSSATIGAHTNVNCAFLRNVMTSYGRLSIRKTFVNCTIISNDCRNGGNYGYICNPNCSLVNCLLSGNKIGYQFYDIRPIYGQSTLTTNALDMVNCLFANCQKGVDEKWEGMVNCRQVSDMKFVDEANGNYTPKYRSPAYNAGCQEPWLLELVGAKDLAGNTRVFGDGIDIGAFECQKYPPGAIFTVR